jgi:hypothetical protein
MLTRLILEGVYGLELSATAIFALILAALCAREVPHQLAVLRIHRDLFRDTPLAIQGVKHTWTREDIRRKPSCRHLSLQQFDAVMDILTGNGVLTRVGERSGQILYGLDLDSTLPDFTLPEDEIAGTNYGDPSAWWEGVLTWDRPGGWPPGLT